MEIVSLKEAKARGLVRYYTGIPCKYGHLCERNVKEARCIECGNAKMRRYWAANEEARQKRNADLRDRWKDDEKRARDLAQRKQRYATDAEFREERRAISAANHQRRYANPAYAEKIRDQCREYARNNRGIFNARIARRRAAELQRTPAWADREAIRIFYESCPVGYHVDHIIPLRGRTVSGLHVLENLQYLPATENLSKGNSFGTTRKIAVVS